MTDAVDTRVLEPVALCGARVELQPLGPEHVAGLVQAYEPGTMDLFRPTIEPLDRDRAERYVAEALQARVRGEQLPFAVVDRASGAVLGSTRYLDVRPDVARLEIGGTWYAPRARGTHVNTECKLLLLEHAFEALACRTVVLRTSCWNHRSQRAIAGIGATYDGTVRGDALQVDGRIRDTLEYSILAQDWPRVRARLERRLDRLDHRAEASAAIRLSTPEDAGAMRDYAVRNRAFHAPYEPVRSDDRYTIEAMREIASNRGGDRVQLLAFDGSHRVVGQAALSNVSSAPAFLNCTIGYSVDEHEQGRGIASALVRHAVAHAVDELGLHRVEAGTLLDNRASQRVLERCGFTRIGVSPRHLRIAGTWQDHLLYAITAEDLR